MTDAEEQLAMIGFARRRRDAVCWRAERVGRPAARPRPGPDLACSPALSFWRDLLARRPVPPAYRISRIAG